MLTTKKLWTNKIQKVGERAKGTVFEFDFLAFMAEVKGHRWDWKYIAK